MTFKLKKQKAKVAHLNVREEKHGEEPVLACDIKIKTDVANTILDELSPGLRQAIFTKDGSQPQLIEGEDYLTMLRFPQLAPLKWAIGITKGEIILHGQKKELDLGFVCDVKDAVLACKEGGTVEMTFQASVHPSPEESGALAGLLGQEIKVSVKPVDQPAQPPLE